MARNTITSAGTINTPVNTEWFGRNKISVTSLDTWEDLYVPAPYFKPNMNGAEGTFTTYPVPGFYIKQIWINNDYIGATNDKRFSVRLYSDTGIVRTLEEDGTLRTVSSPVEMILADNIKVSDGGRIELLTDGSLKLTGLLDKIQIQSNTVITGWNVSCWVEPVTQNWDQRIGDNTYRTSI
jgi:hypothetical protein